jgi:hypothetical protein
MPSYRHGLPALRTRDGRSQWGSRLLSRGEYETNVASLLSLRAHHRHRSFPGVGGVHVSKSFVNVLSSRVASRRLAMTPGPLAESGGVVVHDALSVELHSVLRRIRVEESPINFD